MAWFVTVVAAGKAAPLEGHVGFLLELRS